MGWGARVRCVSDAATAGYVARRHQASLHNCKEFLPSSSSAECPIGRVDFGGFLAGAKEFTPDTAEFTPDTTEFTPDTEEFTSNTAEFSSDAKEFTADPW
jgi:hypothetical protein